MTLPGDPDRRQGRNEADNEDDENNDDDEDEELEEEEEEEEEGSAAVGDREEEEDEKENVENASKKKKRGKHDMKAQKKEDVKARHNGNAGSGPNTVSKKSAKSSAASVPSPAATKPKHLLVEEPSKSISANTVESVVEPVLSKTAKRKKKKNKKEGNVAMEPTALSSSGPQGTTATSVPPTRNGILYPPYPSGFDQKLPETYPLLFESAAFDPSSSMVFPSSLFDPVHQALFGHPNPPNALSSSSSPSPPLAYLPKRASVSSPKPNTIDEYDSSLYVGLDQGKLQQTQKAATYWEQQLKLDIKKNKKLGLI